MYPPQKYGNPKMRDLREALYQYDAQIESEVTELKADQVKKTGIPLN